jgi:predicted dehydrogenase
MMTARDDFSLDFDYRPRMPQNEDIGIGCIGAGFIMADIHLVAYRNAGFNPVAIYSRTRERADEVANRHSIPKVYDDYRDLLDDPSVEIVDIAVPPDIELSIIREVVKRKDHIRGILAQKPVAESYAKAQEIVRMCEEAGIALGVNQNMRYDQSIRVCKSILDRGYLGEPILATIDMRAIPHWMPWQERQGFVTLRMMSTHHLDTFRYLFGDPDRIFASFRTDPRTKFEHEDGIVLYILEYDSGLRASAWDDVWTGPIREGSEGDIYLKWRVEGDEGLAKGTIGWPKYPCPTPSTLDFTTKRRPGYWFQPRWKEVWFPDAFEGTMAQLLCAVEDGTEPEVSGADHLKTVALIDAGYLSAKEHRAVSPQEIIDGYQRPG